MLHLFLSSRDQLRENWLEAFPGAQLFARPQALPAVDNACIWLDTQGLTLALQQQWLVDVASQAAKVVVLNSVPSEQETLKAVQAGAAGYVHCLAVAAQLREVAAVVERGGLWVGPQVAQKLLRLGVGALQQAAEDKPLADARYNEALLSKLTQRESAVAREVARGASNREIAELLSISERTVKAHLSVAFEKLQARDRVQLALMLNNVSL